MKTLTQQLKHDFEALRKVDLTRAEKAGNVVAEELCRAVERAIVDKHLAGIETAVFLDDLIERA